MARRGRKRTENAVREPSGRLSRKLEHVRDRNNAALDREQMDTVSVALEARTRLFKVQATHALDQRAGSFLGRLCMEKTISQAQYEAAQQWLTDTENYSWAMGSPRRPGAIDLNRVHGNPTSAENVGLVKRIKSRYEEGHRVLKEAQIEVRGSANIFGALDALLFRDLELYHLVPDVRIGLNALARFYGLEGRRAA